jgi:hypothetical protein
MEAVRSLPDLYEVVGVSGAERAQDDAYAGVPRMGEAELLGQNGLNAVLVETAIGESCGRENTSIWTNPARSSTRSLLRCVGKRRSAV